MCKQTELRKEILKDTGIIRADWKDIITLTTLSYM